MIERCTDCPLTITGNITTILTFLLGLLASYLTFYTLIRSTLSEIEAFKQELDATRTQLHSVSDCCSSEACLAPTLIHDRDGTLQHSITGLVTTLELLYQGLEGLEREHTQCGGGWWRREEMWRSLRWAWKREQISSRILRISWQKMEVHVSQMSLLLKKMAAQEHRVFSQYEDVLGGESHPVEQGISHC